MRVIHPSAVVSPEVELGEDVEIGPWCVLSGRVRLGHRVRLLANVHLVGPMVVGDGTTFYPFATAGFPPQDYKFKLGDASAGVVIGRDCLIREHATIHAASKLEAPTRLGDRVFLMVNAHVGHDATVGDDVILVNNTALGGHSEVHTRATLAGAVVVHQFNRIGRLAFVTGALAVTMDVPPFCMVGERNKLVGLNQVGLRRSGMPREHITALRAAFREAFWGKLTRPEMVAALRAHGASCPPAMEIADFVASAKRSVARGRSGADEPALDA